jgi:hypothetical protein
MKRIIALAVAVGTAVSLSAVAQARPSEGPRHEARHEGGHRQADVRFIKWVTSQPAGPATLAGASMTGVVRGDVGSGTFQGAVTNDDTTSRPGFWLAQALYGFTGADHSFVAYNFIKEDDAASPVTATIRGLVTGGWMTGARVTGKYTQRDPCPIPTPGNVFGRVCFQGTLHLRLR